MTFKPAKFLDPKSDIVFKKIFGQNADLVKSFLNGVMPFKEGALIETVTYLPTEQIPRIPSLKNTIVDVKCTDQSGRIFIIEMRVLQSKYEVKEIISNLNCVSYIRDGGRPSKIGFQERVLNYLKLLWAKFKVVSVKEKSVRNWQVRFKKTNVM